MLLTLMCCIQGWNISRQTNVLVLCMIRPHHRFHNRVYQARSVENSYRGDERWYLAVSGFGYECRV